ncbi:GSCFA domain-containing protein [Rubritepida flocculans]|uniref:GSCFA domain-containing protein n=1 Tax=Rubritepida flocculans TaxID=182403 RepID=UPI00146F4374|nr:GSCFA domain-containing protein [Rubritepida flocculans]
MPTLTPSRIVVAGNCQAVGLAACLAQFLPGVEVVRRLELTPEDFADPDAGVFLQRPRPDPETRIPAGHRGPVLYWPGLSFAGYHPDVVVASAGGQLLSGGPIGPLHSALVLLGWRLGLGLKATLDLFREDVFERLGYFSAWDYGKTALLNEGRRTDVPLDALFPRWEASGPFMYSHTHPRLDVLADVARGLLSALGMTPEVSGPLPPDWLATREILPIYPEIARRLNVQGSYCFRPGQDKPSLDLEAFATQSFALYDRHDRDEISCARFNTPPWLDLIRDLTGRPAPPPVRRAAVGRVQPLPKLGPPLAAGTHPYAGLPEERFWRRAVQALPMAQVDPVVRAPFRITRHTAIATAGSCFAQHIGRVLAAEGCNYLVTEPAPPGLSRAEAHRAQYGIFSARYGNLYTTAQLLQLFERAYGRFLPQEPAWLRADGRVVDPFRPEVEPNGYGTVEEMLTARAEHLAAVRRMFQECEVFVFTLGLTEGWRSRVDGAVFPLAPGVSGGHFDPERHEFVNFSMREVLMDLRRFKARLQAVNPRARMMITVSPVPLMATYEDRHVMVSTAASKAILRTVADEMVRADPSVWYFPSYEIITGSYNRGAYYEADARSVTEAGVAHVMRLFLAHVLSREEPGDAMAAEAEELLGVICDEAKLDV